MGIDLGAFASGFAGEYLDSVKQRSAAEEKAKEMKLLQQLRQETAEWEMKEREKQDRKKVKTEDFDPTSGERVGYNEFGEEISRRTDAAGLEAYRQNKTKFDLDVQNTQSQIQHRTLSHGLEVQRLQESRADRAQRGRESSAAAGGDGGFTTGIPSVDLGRKLFGANKTVIDAAIRDGIPAEVLDRLTVQAVAQAGKSGGGAATAQDNFLRGISHLRKGLDAGSWSEEKYREGRSLDSIAPKTKPKPKVIIVD